VQVQSQNGRCPEGGGVLSAAASGPGRTTEAWDCSQSDWHHLPTHMYWGSTLSTVSSTPKQ
jgi:hypothetical protein